MKDLVFDIQRALLVLRISLKYSVGPIVRYILRLPPRGVSYAVRIRLAMEELGLTYLKLGQFLAMRFDILPVEVCRELNKLFEDVPPMTFEEAKAVVESELQGSFKTFFPIFNREPIAAASVAQVHEARTHANERVAVKIQRPGIERIFAADMRNLHRIAALVDAFGLFGALSLKEAADEFANYTQREMDFIIEGGTADRVRKNAMPYEIVPKIYWELTTSKVLTMEFIDGVSLSQLSNLLEAGRNELVKKRLPNLDLEQVLHNLAFASLNQIFVSGFFHGDPHPGNILVRDDNTVGFVDFGIFGELTDDQREILANYIEHLAVGNINESFRYCSKLYTPTDESDQKAFKHETKSILSRWYQASKNPDSPIQERHSGKYSGEIIEVLRRNRLRMSMDTLLFWRALTALDSSILRLSAQFDLLSELRDFFEQTRPGLVQRVLELVTDRSRAITVAELAREMPDHFTGILNNLTEGHYELPLYVEESPEMQRGNATDTKWLTVGVLGLSLTVLATAIHLDMPIRMLIIGLAILLFILSIAEGRRR